MLNQDEYRETFNGEAEVAGSAPGRVNLIGQFFILILIGQYGQSHWSVRPVLWLMIVTMQGSTLTTMKASSYPWPCHWSLWWSAGASIIIDIVVVMIFIIVIIVIIITIILILITRKKEGNLCRVVTTGVSKETVEVNQTLSMKLIRIILMILCIDSIDDIDHLDTTILFRWNWQY